MEELLTKIKNLLWGKDTYTFTWTIAFICICFMVSANNRYEYLESEYGYYCNQIHEILKDNPNLLKKVEQLEEDIMDEKENEYDSFYNSRGY